MIKTPEEMSTELVELSQKADKYVKSGHAERAQEKLDYVIDKADDLKIVLNRLR